MLLDSEKEGEDQQQQHPPIRQIQRNYSGLQIISEENRPPKETAFRKNLAMLSGRASPMPDTRRKVDFGVLNSSSNYATPIAEYIRPATEVNTPIHSFSNLRLYRQNSDINTSLDYEADTPGPRNKQPSPSPANTSLRLEFSTQREMKKQGWDIQRSESAQSCYPLESGGSICEFGDICKPVGYSRPTTSFKNK